MFSRLRRNQDKAPATAHSAAAETRRGDRAPRGPPPALPQAGQRPASSAAPGGGGGARGLDQFITPSPPPPYQPSAPPPRRTPSAFAPAPSAFAPAPPRYAPPPPLVDHVSSLATAAGTRADPDTPAPAAAYPRSPEPPTSARGPVRVRGRNGIYEHADDHDAVEDDHDRPDGGNPAGRSGNGVGSRNHVGPPVGRGPADHGRENGGGRSFDSNDRSGDYGRGASRTSGEAAAGSRGRQDDDDFDVHNAGSAGGSMHGLGRTRRATEGALGGPGLPVLSGLSSSRRRATTDAASGAASTPAGSPPSSAHRYPSMSPAPPLGPPGTRHGILTRRGPRTPRPETGASAVPPSPGSASPWDGKSSYSAGGVANDTNMNIGPKTSVDDFYANSNVEAGSHGAVGARTDFSAGAAGSLNASLGDPLEDAIVSLLVTSGALEEIASIEAALPFAGKRRRTRDDLMERKSRIAAAAVSLASKRNVVRTPAELEDLFDALAFADQAADTGSAHSGARLGYGVAGEETSLSRLNDQKVEAASKAEEPLAEKTARLTPRAEWIAEELRTQAGSLFPADVDTFAAMLALLADKSNVTIAAMTIVYNLKSPGVKVAKGEAAVVWRSDARIEKTVKQFIRVFEKLSAAAECMSSEGSHVEVVANAYELSSGHENARYTLSVLIALLAVMMRVDRRMSHLVWLQPVDIHAATPTACAREWDPNDGSIILSVKGPWPWGDVIRTSVTTVERRELALTLTEGELPVLDRLEEQASELLEQKKEKHVFLLGETGVGKSTLGNTLIGTEIFFVDAFKTGTIFPQPQMTNWGTERQVVWDTPGLNDAKNRDPLFLKEIALIVDRVQLAAAVVLVVRSPARIPHSLVTALEKYIDLFGPQLSSVLYIVINDSSRVYPADEIEMYTYTVAEQLADELGLHLEPGFLLQIPTGNHQLPPDVKQLQLYNTQWLKQAVIQSRPVLTRMGHQTIESLLALRTTLDTKQQQYYRRQLMEQSGRQREGLQLLLSRADVRKAFFSKNGYILMQTWDLSRTSRILQVLQQQDSRMQQKREIRITPDNLALGKEVAHALALRKTHYSSRSRKIVRATTPEDIFSAIADLGLVLIPLTVPTLAENDAVGPEGYAAARPGDRVSQRTLKAIADVLADTNTAESVVRLVQSCIEDTSSDITL